MFVFPRADLFNILFYAPKDVDVPPEFVEADAHVISGNTEMVSLRLLVPACADAPLRWSGEADGLGLWIGQVKLRSFSTNRHKVEGLVAYKVSGLPVLVRDRT